MVNIKVCRFRCVMLIPIFIKHNVESSSQETKYQESCIFNQGTLTNLKKISVNIKQRSQQILRCLPLFLRGLTVLGWNRHPFPRYKLAAFQTYNKENTIKNVFIWVEILQFRKDTIAVITWPYLNARMRISKALRK